MLIAILARTDGIDLVDDQHGRCFGPRLAEVWRISRSMSPRWPAVCHSPTLDREVILVMVEGKVRFRAAGQDWGPDGCLREDATALPLCPERPDWTAEAKTDCTIAVCSAPGRGGHPARRMGPEGISLTQRGEGTNTRFNNNIAMEAENYCDSLLVTGVFTPAGYWSSFPSHRHDEDDFPRITYLEETYYHRLTRPRGGRCSGSIR